MTFNEVNFMLCLIKGVRIVLNRSFCRQFFQIKISKGFLTAFVKMEKIHDQK